MKIEFTTDELAACRALLEVALKQVGKQAVPAYVRLETMFEKALAEENPAPAAPAKKAETSK